MDSHVTEWKVLLLTLLSTFVIPVAQCTAENTAPTRAALYASNRAPLGMVPFIKLPIGSITPKGWVRRQLELEAQGMTGHLEEISPWLNFEKSAWVHPESGTRGWEEMPYWLKGYGDLGYVLNDAKIIDRARQWIDAILAGQEESGWFGPRSLKTSLEGNPDLWPHMLVLNILQSFHEFSEDPRVIPFMLRYHRWLDAQPAATFARGYWPKLRFGDNIETVYWLYNRTGESWLLPLAKKIHDNMGRWSEDVVNWHNVNLAQGFRTPGIFYQQGRDENCRPGYGDPRQGFETCGMVEFMHSFEMLTRISGDPIWAERCEDIAFNSLPAALTPDWKALHYLTSPNMVQLDRNNKAPSVDNEGTMFSYSPFEVYRCCQHNVSHGWPYYAEELWLATSDRGLCASLYAASEVRAKVGDGETVTISEETGYPFSDIVTFKVSSAAPVKFPIHLRIPSWCQEPTIQIDGESVIVDAKRPTYTVIDRTWHDGETLTLHLPMRIAVRRWEKNQNAASVHYGPLAFSLEIGEKWSRYGKVEAWPESEVFPTTAWNYGLELDETTPDASFKLVKKPGPLAANPFTLETAPIELRAKARKIPQWRQDARGVVGKLQPSPVKSDEPVETVSLIPMGAARLRITTFPVIGHAPDARDWALTQ